MIQTGIESRVKIQDVISSQLPNFILDVRLGAWAASPLQAHIFLSIDANGGRASIVNDPIPHFCPCISECSVVLSFLS